MLHGSRTMVLLVIVAVIAVPIGVAQDGDLSFRAEKNVYSSYLGFSGLDFSASGIRVYSSSWDGFIHQHMLSQNWDAATTQSEGQVNVQHQVNDIVMQPDGSHVYTLSGDYPDPPWNQPQLIKWDLTNLGDVTTMNTDLDSSTGKEMTQMGGRALAINDAGDKLHVLEGGVVTQYSMSSWDISTLSAEGSMTLASGDTPRDIWFSSDGSSMFALFEDRGGSQVVRQFSLSTAWDVTTSSQVADIQIPSSSDNTRGFAFGDSGSKMGLIQLNGYMKSYDFTPATGGSSSEQVVELTRIGTFYNCHNNNGGIGEDYEVCDIDIDMENNDDSSHSISILPTVYATEDGSEDVNLDSTEWWGGGQGDALVLDAGTQVTHTLEDIPREHPVNCDSNGCSYESLASVLDIHYDPPGELCTSWDTTTITTSPDCGSSDNGPTADFIIEDTTDLTVTVEGGSSTGADEYEWRWKSGGSFNSLTDTEDHTYSSGGTYTITLRVSDSDGNTDTTSDDVTVSSSGGPDTASKSVSVSSSGGGGGGADAVDGCSTADKPGTINPFYPNDCPLNMSGMPIFDSEQAVTIEDDVNVSGDVGGQGGDYRLDLYQSLDDSMSNAKASWSWIEMWGNHGSREGELTLAGKYLAFRTGSSTSALGTEKMTLDESGRLGIGANSPSDRLHIREDTSGSVRARLDNPNSNGYSSLRFNEGSNARAALYFDNGADNFNLQNAQPGGKLRLQTADSADDTIRNAIVIDEKQNANFANRVSSQGPVNFPGTTTTGHYQSTGETVNCPEDHAMRGVNFDTSDENGNLDDDFQGICLAKGDFLTGNEQSRGGTDGGSDDSQTTCGSDEVATTIEVNKHDDAGDSIEDLECTDVRDGLTVDNPSGDDFDDEWMMRRRDNVNNWCPDGTFITGLRAFGSGGSNDRMDYLSIRCGAVVPNFDSAVGSGSPTTTSSTTSGPSTTGPSTTGPSTSCFVAGTKITMADGSTKPIEKVEVGDQVVSYDAETGERVTSTVSETLVHTEDNTEKWRDGYWKIGTGSGHVMQVTDHHPIYVIEQNGENYYEKARNVEIGDTVMVKTGDGMMKDTISSKNRVGDGPEKVYNFHVENEPHNYLAEGVVVHNVKIK